MASNPMTGSRPLPGVGTYDVFMSHASEDKKVVGAVVERLRASGLTVWYDESHITGSAPISKKINDALDASRVLVYCLSSDAVASKWVQAEVAAFSVNDPNNEAGRIVVLAIDTTPATGTQRQWARIDWSTGRSESTFSKLLAACQSGGRPLQARPDPAMPPLQAIEQEFGFDPQILARHYVEPNLQDFNPPDLDTDPGRRVSKEPALQWFRDDCARDITNENGARILFILGDAGMGKTSLLVRLKCLDLEKPLREGHRAELMRLNSDTLARIQAITDPIHTLLLLDSLDEDPEAHHASRGAAERLRQLFPHLQRFFRVVISCRTQFFPETSPHLTDRPGSFCLDAYRCPLKYLSLFNDQQVETYLRQRFTPGDFRSVFKRLLSDKADQKLERARTAARAMESLRMRPLLLSYIEDFVTGEGATQLDHRNRYAVYDFLVSQWLQRERRLNKHLGLDIEQGWSVATALAIHLTATDRRKIPRAELLNIPGLEAIDRFQIESRSLLNRTTHFEFQFAHATFQEFLVARALLKNDASLTGKRLRLSPVTGRFLIDGYSMLGRTINVKTLHGAVLASPCAPLCRLFLGVDMIEVSPGTFQMGSPENEPSRLNDEGPQHSVTLTHGFWLGKFPVTQEQYQRIMGTNPSLFKGPNQPVETVSWREAGTFCERLTQEGLASGVLPPDWEFRLPTEAEWEYACRAGTTNAFSDGSPCTRPAGKDPALDRLGWFDKNSRTKTHPVGEKQPNAWGFHDCHGNVWEWCLDGRRTYRDQAESDPVGPLDGA